MTCRNYSDLGLLSEVLIVALRWKLREIVKESNAQLHRAFLIRSPLPCSFLDCLHYRPPPSDHFTCLDSLAQSWRCGGGGNIPGGLHGFVMLETRNQTLDWFPKEPVLQCGCLRQGRERAEDKCTCCSPFSSSSFQNWNGGEAILVDVDTKKKEEQKGVGFCHRIGRWN